MDRVTRAVGSVLVWPIRAYQRFVSPLLGDRCRFYPSCSEYMARSITKHGPLHGLYLGTRRLLRCHPWNPGGFDEVPEAFSWRKPHLAGDANTRRNLSHGAVKRSRNFPEEAA